MNLTLESSCWWRNRRWDRLGPNAAIDLCHSLACKISSWSLVCLLFVLLTVFPTSKSTSSQLILFAKKIFRELVSWIPGTYHLNTTVAHNCPITWHFKEIQMHVDKPKSPHAGSNVHGRKSYSWCIWYSWVFYPLSERISKHVIQKNFMQLLRSIT